MSSINNLLAAFPKKQVHENEPLSKHTYFKLGGPADLFIVVKNADELAKAVILAEKNNLKWFILGGGSNILVGDLGFRGVVIKNEAEKLVARGSWLVAESGVLMSKLVAFANRHGLGGLEMFMSLPGTLGGAIFNNSHFRPEKNELVGNLVVSAEILKGPKKGSDLAERSDPVRWRRVIVDRDWFKFRYDYSRLQDELGVVLSVTFRLKKELPEILTRRSLELIKHRNSYQPIGEPSCGCIWQNVNSISAGKLVDEAGLKGTRVGGVRVSEKHGNFFINDGTATVDEVLELMSRVKKKVSEHSGVELKQEIFMVGEFTSSRACREIQRRNVMTFRSD